MPVERLRMRPWLENIINGRTYPGVEWVDEKSKTFRLPWKHASRNGWKINTDACLFQAWAEHTGKFKEKEQPNPKIWKANFRCALNSLPDMEEVTEKRMTKGNNAFKVYRIVNKSSCENKKSATKKYKGRQQRKRRSVSRTNSQKDSKPKMTEDDAKPALKGESLEVEIPFTVPTREICRQHLVDHDYTQTRYFDIYEEDRDICEGFEVSESKVIKTEPRSPVATNGDCCLYEENEGTSKKRDIEHPSHIQDDRVLSDDELVEMIDELSSECDSNGSLEMDEFPDGCNNDNNNTLFQEDLPPKKERANSAPASLDFGFSEDLPDFPTPCLRKSKSLSGGVQSILSATSAQDFLQSCMPSSNAA